MEGRPRGAAGHIGADAVDDRVVVEQALELLQVGLEAQAELGGERGQIGPGVSIPERGSGVPSVRLVRFLSTSSAYKTPENNAISHRKLVLQL